MVDGGPGSVLWPCPDLVTIVLEGALLEGGAGMSPPRLYSSSCISCTELAAGWGGACSAGFSTGLGGLGW